MGGLFIAGVFAAFTLVIAATAAFFFLVWQQRREAPYLLLGMTTFCTSGYIGSVALGYWIAGGGAAWPTLRTAAHLAVVAGFAAIALLLQFALRHSGSRHERPVMTVAFSVAITAVVAVLIDGFLTADRVQIVTITVFGMEAPAFFLQLTPLAAAVCTMLLVGNLVVWGLFIKAYIADRAANRGVLIGGSVLMATVVNDVAALALGLYESISMVPLGFLSFAYFATVGLVQKYGRLATTLEKRTAELRQRSEQLTASLGELKQTQDDLLQSEQLAVVGEFAAVITHEVRNPMAIVNNAVTSLSKVDSVTDDTRGLLAIIEDEMARLERLVTLLLNYARPVVPQRGPAPLRELVMRSLHPVVDTSVDLTIECDSEWPTLTVDAELMRQAFDNIVANAVQAMSGHGDLAVHIARRRVQRIDCIVIGFEDTGEGMTEHQVEQAVSPFYSTRPSGAGLGLAICDRIIDAHGGRMIVESELGVGTAVSMILPVNPDEHLEHAAPLRM